MHLIENAQIENKNRKDSSEIITETQIAYPAPPKVIEQAWKIKKTCTYSITTEAATRINW